MKRNPSRRDLLIKAAGATLIPGALASAGPVNQPPEFVRSGTIRGIGTVAPIGNWGATTYGLTQRRTAALHDAGFNTLRVFVSLREFDEAQLSGSSLDVAKVTRRWVDYVRNGVEAGFKVLVSWSSSFDDRLALLSGRPTTDRFRRALSAISQGLAKAFDPGLVALEIMNEPPEELRLIELGLKPWSTTFAPLFFSDIRNAAPALTMIIQSSPGGWAEAIPNFDPINFDANTMFCFHFYTPGEFTHQGINYPHFYGVPFPITRYPGGKEAMETTILARVAADPQINETEKKQLSSKYRVVIDYLWAPDSPLGPTWVTWPKLDASIADRRIDPRRLLCGEFEVASNCNFNGSPGTDVISRANYLRAVRLAVETRAFGGWVAHQALGDFNLFEETSVSQQGEALIPELVDALFR